MNRLKDIITTVIAAAIIALGSWMIHINNRVYEFQAKYVTHAQMNEAVKNLDQSIKSTIQGEESERQAQQAIFMQWLNRIEQQQMILSSDIKQLLKESK